MNRDDKHTFASMPAIRTLKGKLENSVTSGMDGEKEFYTNVRLTFSRTDLLLIHTSSSPGE